MQVPLSVVILLIVVIAVAGVFILNYATKYPGSEQNVLPVKASFPSGNPIYKVSNAYIIPIRFSKSTEKPIGVCRMDISYLDASNNVRKATVVFATSRTSYRTTVTFSNGVVELPIPVINQPSVDTRITIRFNSGGYQLNAITLYYCEYGVSTEPKWSETLMIPETVLSP